MSDFVQQAVQLAPSAMPSWLTDHAKSSRDFWSKSTLPTRKTEAWKYTRLRPLETGNYLNAAKPATADASLIQPSLIDGLNVHRLVFIDGQFQQALSDSDMPEGAELVRFADANERQVDSINQHLGSLFDRENHLFSALNDAWLKDGLFLRFKKNTRVEQPVQVISLTTSQEQAFSIAQRLLVLVEEQAEATVIEHFASTNEEQNSFTNSVTELVLEADAKLHHYRLHLEEEQSIHIGGVHAGLGRSAQLNSFQIALGSKLKRLDVVINHQGEGAHCELNGVYLPQREQHVDFHTCIEHAVPNCTTNEVFRGIVSDSAQAVFNGRIHIHPGAQKTSAMLSNKNLLTSNKAEVDTKPELEIYADDVQCAHGATVAQIDEQLLYYFLSRGISRQEAEVMLSFGFINELLNQVHHQEIGDYLRPLLAKRFAADPKMTRHIT
jgi:Fe-S cluster assembly protein SufD